MKCNTEGCKNKARKNARDCEKCHSRKFRESHPIKSRYYWLKKSAKKRNYEFTISYTYFEKLCLESNYHNLSGRGTNNLTIDRVINELGYVEGNIRVVTKHINSTKRDKDLPFDNITEECPFY